MTPRFLAPLALGAFILLLLLLLMLAPAVAFQPREDVTQDRTYYFRPDAPVDANGNEVNNCTSDKVVSTPGYPAPDGACRYLQTGMDIVGKLRFDIPVTVTIKVGGSGFRKMVAKPGAQILGVPILGTMFMYDPHEGNGALRIVGDIDNPYNVVLESVDGHGFWCRAPNGHGAPIVSGPVFIEGFHFEPSRAWGVRWSCRGTLSVGHVVFGDTCVGGVCGAAHMGVDWGGADLATHGPITVEGTAKTLVHSDMGSVWLHNYPIHIDPKRAPSFIDGTVHAFHRSMTWIDAVWSGSTGGSTPKYIIKSGATVKNVQSLPGILPGINHNGFVE